MIRDKLVAFLYWAAYWFEQAADRVWYGRDYQKQAPERLLRFRP